MKRKNNEYVAPATEVIYICVNSPILVSKVNPDPTDPEEGNNPGGGGQGAPSNPFLGGGYSAWDDEL